MRSNVVVKNNVRINWNTNIGKIALSTIQIILYNQDGRRYR